MTKSFLNTSFETNEVFTVNPTEIRINLNPSYQVTTVFKTVEIKENVILLCHKALKVAFSCYNPNAFLGGLATKGEVSVDFYTRSQQGFLTLEMGLYGLKRAGLAEANTLQVVTSIPCSEGMWYSESYEGDLDSNYEYIIG